MALDGQGDYMNDREHQQVLIGDLHRALFALREENRVLRDKLAAVRPCECCGAPLVKVENGRATCEKACSYEVAEST